jgi:large subunit ribosomal protein L30
MAAKRLKVTLVRSLSGQKPSHRKTVAALGLRRIGSSVEHDENPAMLGMIRAVAHLIRVEETS